MQYTATLHRELVLCVCAIGLASSQAFLAAETPGDSIQISVPYKSFIGIDKITNEGYKEFKPTRLLLEAFLKKNGLGVKETINYYSDGDFQIKNLVSGECDMIALKDHLVLQDQLMLEWKHKLTGWKPDKFYIGQRKVAVLVNAANPVNIIDLKSIHMILLMYDRRPLMDLAPAGHKELFKGKECLSWKMIAAYLGRDTKDFTGEYPVNAYICTEDTPAHNIVKHICAKLPLYSPWNSRSWIGIGYGKKGYKSYCTLCENAEKVISNVKNNTNAIGFVMENELPTSMKGIKLLKVSRRGPKSPISLPRGFEIDKDYPLAENYRLLLSPSAPDLARRFGEFCISKAGAEVVEKCGVITPWHEKQHHADRRVKAMKAGKGKHIRMIGDALFAEAAQDLAVAYVRAKKPIQLHYVPHEPGIDAGYVRRFVTAAKRKPDYRMPLFLCRGPLAPGGEKDLPGLKQYRLAADAPVVVVNAANDIPSLTPDAVAKIFTGRVTRWGAVSASTGRIAACVLKKDSAVGRYVSRHRVGGIPPAIHRCGDRRALFGRIASDVKAIGLVGAAHLAGGRDRLPGGVRVVPMAGREGPVMPGGKTIMSGAYPLSAGMHACVAGDVGEAAADLVAFLRSRDAQAAFEACGMITAASRLSIPGDGDAAAPDMPAGDGAVREQGESGQDTKREEQKIPEPVEGDGVGGLPFD